MKASELRIGNYVLDSEDENIMMITCGGQIDKYELAQPIPLTEEWLLKFGFEKRNNYYFIDTDYRVAYIKDHFAISVGDDEYGIVLRKIEYVHELQNIYFALIEKELTY
jgi:hypothetical protein